MVEAAVVAVEDVAMVVEAGDLVDGDEVEITCTIHASPPAEVEWYRNGQLLDPRQVVISRRGNRHTLMLHNIGQLSLDHLENIIYHFPVREK